MPTRHDEFSDGLEDLDDSDPELTVSDLSVAAPATTRKPKAKTPRTSAAVGVGKTTSEPVMTLDAPFHSSEAETLWPEMIERLYKNGRSPHEINIRVIRVDPPPRMTIPGAIDGAAVSGSDEQNAGDALIDVVTENYHLPFSRTPARYTLQFTWKLNGRVWGNGSINLPAPEAIMAMRRSLQNYRVSSQGVGQPQYVPPPQYANYSQPQYPQQSQNQHGSSAPAVAHPYPAGAGFGAPYYNAREAELQADLQRAHEREAYLKGQLERAGLQPQVPPQTLGHAPHEPVSDIERRLARMEGMIERLAGLGQVNAAPVQSTAITAPSPAMDFTTMSNQMMNNLMQSSIKQVFGAFEKTLKNNLSNGLGAPSEDDGEEESKVAVAVPNPEDDLPFKGIAIPEAKWPDGRPVIFPKDKENGGINLPGIAFGNPYLAEKIVDGINAGVNSFAEAIKNITRPATQPPPQMQALPQAPVQIPFQASQPLGVGQVPEHAQTHVNGALKFSNGWD